VRRSRDDQPAAGPVFTSHITDHSDSRIYRQCSEPVFSVLAEEINGNFAIQRFFRVLARAILEIRRWAFGASVSAL
jgi:hypothetical protein